MILASFCKDSNDDNRRSRLIPITRMMKKIKKWY